MFFCDVDFVFEWRSSNDYICFWSGPWCVGELLTGEYGFVCVHGVYVLQHFIPGAMTYFYGLIQVYNMPTYTTW